MRSGALYRMHSGLRHNKKSIVKYACNTDAARKGPGHGQAQVDLVVQQSVIHSISVRGCTCMKAIGTPLACADADELLGR